MITRREEFSAYREMAPTPAASEAGFLWPRFWANGGTATLENLALLSRIDQAVAETGGILPRSAARTNGEQGDDHAPLRLLSFAYANGVLDSEEICRLCTSEDCFRKLCPGQLPQPDALCQFRREHRERLEAILVQVLPEGENRTSHAGDRLVLPTADGNHRKHLRARSLLNLARHLDTFE
jgi:hypothetical protein